MAICRSPVEGENTTLYSSDFIRLTFFLHTKQPFFFLFDFYNLFRDYAHTSWKGCRAGNLLSRIVHDVFQIQVTAKFNIDSVPIKYTF